MATVGIIMETYNETEHSSTGRLEEALAGAERAAAEHGDARVLVADSGGNPAVAALLAERYPAVERVPAVGCGYDEAKALTARAAGTEIVAYLDGDCVPEAGWLSTLTEPIAEGRAVAVAGVTQYEGGFLARVMSVLDFGFLLPARERDVGCYASNNAAFDAATLEAVPPPRLELRSTCFAHAQAFERRGTPMRLVPAARARHELVPIVRERLRRGFDLVAAQQDPALREARWLRLGVLAAPLFLAYNLQLDVRRLVGGGATFGLGGLQRVAALPVMVGLRLIDVRGIVAALRGRPCPT